MPTLPFLIFYRSTCQPQLLCPTQARRQPAAAPVPHGIHQSGVNPDLIFTKCSNSSTDYNEFSLPTSISIHGDRRSLSFNSSSGEMCAKRWQNVSPHCAGLHPMARAIRSPATSDHHAILIERIHRIHPLQTFFIPRRRLRRSRR